MRYISKSLEKVVLEVTKEYPVVLVTGSRQFSLKCNSLRELIFSQLLHFKETFSNEELFTKKAFDWTGTTSLGSYCVSATFSHYDWATKDIKKALKKWREAR